MLFRRGLAAIVVAHAAVGTAVALTGACSLTTSTDGLSGGAASAVDASAAPPLPEDATPDGASASDAGDAGDATPSRFPPEAQTWPGNGHGYALYVVPGGLTWNEARARAEQGGGHLVTIGSSAENDFVIAMLAGRSDAFNPSHVGPWLGGFQDAPTDADEPGGKWRWVDGTPWTFTF